VYVCIYMFVIAYNELTFGPEGISAVEHLAGGLSVLVLDVVGPP
jgi:hypothetical protein